MLTNLKYDNQSVLTGDIAVFYLTSPWVVNQEGLNYTKNTNVPQHSAIFIITDSQGNKYFLNRLNIYEKVTMNKLTGLQANNKRIAKRAQELTGSEPYINENPTYYH